MRNWGQKNAYQYFTFVIGCYPCLYCLVFHENMVKPLSARGHAPPRTYESICTDHQRYIASRVSRCYVRIIEGLSVSLHFRSHVPGYSRVHAIAGVLVLFIFGCDFVRSDLLSSTLLRENTTENRRSRQDLLCLRGGCRI